MQTSNEVTIRKGRLADGSARSTAQRRREFSDLRIYYQILNAARGRDYRKYDCNKRQLRPFSMVQTLDLTTTESRLQKRYLCTTRGRQGRSTDKRPIVSKNNNVGEMEGTEGHKETRSGVEAFETKIIEESSHAFCALSQPS